MPKNKESQTQYGSPWSLLAAVIFAVGAGFLFATARMNISLCSEQCATPDVEQLGTVGEVIDAVPVDIRSLRIDGTPTPDGNDPELPVFVMIDNHPDARPQYGLNEASIVYETLVEGGFTRYAAVFQNSTVEVIGPVRSARDYFLPFAAEWSADYAHSGGSPQALADIDTHDIKDIEEISYLGPDYFWRSTRKLAPHNLYTHAEYLSEARGRLGYPSEINWSNWQPWSFVPTGGFAQVNNVDTSSDQVDVEWSFRTSANVSFVYDSETRSYVRWLGEEKDIDFLTDEVVRAHTIVLVHVPEEVVLDAAGRLKMDVLGSGDVDVFSEGVHVSGTWEKKQYNDRMMFTRDNDQNIIFTPGKIWIMVVPEGTDVRD